MNSASLSQLSWAVRDLGRQPFMRVWPAMERFTDTRADNAIDELWLVEHDPVFTLGQAGKPEHVLASGDIPVVQTNRGGQVTYHGPGQIVAYPLVDLRRMGIGVREFVYRIEQAIIDTIATWQIQAVRKEGAPGVYVNGEKIGALGLRVRRGCTFHGLAFNIDMNLEPFLRINPCGYHGLQVTSLLNCGGSGDVNAVKFELVKQMAKQLQLTPHIISELPEPFLSTIEPA
jgi:lipoyl(octanoyl) transferase